MSGLHSSARSSLCQTSPHPDSMILELVEGKWLYAFDSVAKKGKGVYEAISKQVSINFPLDYNFYMVGSCNGILCLHADYMTSYIRHLVLWNPFTRTYVELPPLPDDFKRRHPTMLEAFGYDHVNDDYKVVKFYVWASNYDNDRVGCHWYDLCVYSLKHNSWKTIMDGIPFEMPEEQFLDHPCTVTNGAAHWLVKGYSWLNSNSFILAFDLATYEFRKISVTIDDEGFTKMCCLISGCLSLVCYPDRYVRRQNNGVAEIWVMEVYGVEASWNRLTSIEFTSGGVSDVTPVVFIEKRGKLLLKLDSKKKLVFYDINRKSFSQVSIKGETEYCTGGRSCVCECRIDCPSFWTKDYFVCVGTFASPFTLED